VSCKLHANKVTVTQLLLNSQTVLLKGQNLCRKTKINLSDPMLKCTHHHRFSVRFSMLAQVGRFSPNELLHFILLMPTLH